VRPGIPFSAPLVDDGEIPGHRPLDYPMLLTITTTHRPATDLGYLLHKHPVRFQPIGPADEAVGAPTQMAMFERGGAEHG
jgi:RNA repair, ligase-Pnkp-associating, region of Hen1